MKKYRGFLLDMDGTLCRGDEPIPDAHALIKGLRQQEIPFLVLTNNSTRTPQQVAAKLQNMGIAVFPEEIFTSGMATARYLRKAQIGRKVYMIGEEGLRIALEEEGFELVTGEREEEAEIVVVGLDRQVTYEKLARACLAIRKGARFVSTNGDIALPTERGLLPGNGSITALIATATETRPVFIGKPEPVFTDLALEKLQTPKEETVLVGDNLLTDIMAGKSSGMDTVLLLTGITSPEQARASDIRPTYTYRSIQEMLQDFFWLRH